MKRFFALFIAAVLLISLCACGKKSADTDKNSDNTVTVGQVTYKIDSKENTAAVTGCNSAATFAVVQDVVKNCNVVKIEDGAFKDIATLNHVILPDTITAIGVEAFSGCEHLVAINFPSGLNTIAKRAFKGCPILTADLPTSVTRVGVYAFEDCKNLRYICFPDSVEKLKTNVVNGCDMLENIIASKESDAYKVFESEYKGRIKTTVNGLLDDVNFSCAREAGDYKYSVITNDFDIVITGYTGTETGELKIPETIDGFKVVRIGYAAFVGSKISGVIIPQNVYAIKKEAFSGCTTLTSVKLPAAVTEIDDDAFSGCTALTSVSAQKGSFGESWATKNKLAVTY